MSEEYVLQRIRELIVAGHQTLERIDWFGTHRQAGFLTPPYSRRDFLESFDFSRRDDQLLPEMLYELYQLSVDLAESGEPELSAACMRMVLAFASDNVSAHFSVGISLMTLGRFAEAAPYLITWYDLSVKGHSDSLKAWKGEDLSGKVLLVVSDQGIGDMAQFMRFIPEVAKRCGKLYLSVKRAYIRAISPIEGATIIDHFPDGFDYICNLEVLPHIVGIDESRLGGYVPYLRAEPDRVAAWRPRLPQAEFRIGIAWFAGPDQVGGRDVGRGVPLASFLPVARIPGVRLVCLQILDGAAKIERAEGMGELNHLPEGMEVTVLGDDFDAGADKLIDTLAVMESLDLVISCDTSIAHLAGACGHPVMLLLRKACNWRWMQDRSDSPWYPTMRIFRQTVAGDWDDVLNRVAVEVAKLAAVKKAGNGAAMATPWPRDHVVATMVTSLIGSGSFHAENCFHAEAIAAFQQAVALCPDHAAATAGLAISCFHRAGALIAEGRLAEAEAALRKALAGRSRFAEAGERLAELLLIRARAWIAAGRPRPAEAALREVLYLRPDNLPARDLLQSLPAGPAEGTGRDALIGEETALRQAIAGRPAEAGLVEALAVNLLNQTQSAYQNEGMVEAEIQARKCLAVAPDFAQAREAMSIILYQAAVPLFNSHRFAEAEAHLWEIVPLRPSFAEAPRLLDLCARHPVRTVAKLADPRYEDPAVTLLDALRLQTAVGRDLTRIGARFDGGYVMVDRGLDDVVAYSLGVGGDVTWDFDMAERGCHIFQFDHTVAGLPTEHDNFHWRKIGIGATPSADPVFRTIEELIVENGHQERDDLILKTDIEGAEWPMIAAMSERTLCRFSQITGEFHDFTRIADPAQRQLILGALAKLNRHFQLVHLHPNNMSTVAFIGGVVVYDALELTFLRRQGESFVPAAGDLPLDIDFRCKPDAAEYQLRGFGR